MPLLPCNKRARHEVAIDVAVVQDSVASVADHLIQQQRWQVRAVGQMTSASDLIRPSSFYPNPASMRQLTDEYVHAVNLNSFDAVSELLHAHVEFVHRAVGQRAIMARGVESLGQLIQQEPRLLVRKHLRILNARFCLSGAYLRLAVSSASGAPGGSDEPERVAACILRIRDHRISRIAEYA